MDSIAKLRDATPRIVCVGLHQGIIQSILDYEYLCGQQSSNVLAIVAGGRKQQRFFWGTNEIILPVYSSVQTLPDSVKAEVTMAVLLQSARRILETMSVAVKLFPELRVATIFAEQVPERHALEIAQVARKHSVMIVGPASVGLLLPGLVKLGAIGGTTPTQIERAHITEPGDVAVISTSGGMVNELIHMVTSTHNRVSFALALGGDRFAVTTPAQAMLLAEHDEKTAVIVYFGELGGQDEYEIIGLIKQKKITKPMVAYIAGEVATLFKEPPQFGHAKALAKHQDESAAAKKQAMRRAGVRVVESLAEISVLLRERAPDEEVTTKGRSIGERRHALIASQLSGDRAGELTMLNQNFLEMVDERSFASLALSMFLGRPIDAPKLVAFTDYVFKLLVDHGPYVSGAVNTVVAARAGKDLVSSLAAGLLTIGPRFGGAINESARCWLNGVSSNTTPKEFVKANKGIIPGIGHKKYRIDLPDPRVAKLSAFAPEKGRYLEFARGVQAITTAKKGNLILNVDGCVAATMLDLLETELKLSKKELDALIDVEFFNALFVLSRSVGFMAHYMDQRRNDEGLLRLDDSHVTYILK